MENKTGYLGVRPYGENWVFASVEDGQLTLDFGKDFDTLGQNDGKGLNQDTVFEFDKVFCLYANDNVDPFDVWIESKHDAITFYWCKKKSGPATKNNSMTLDLWKGDTNVDVDLRIDLDN